MQQIQEPICVQDQDQENSSFVDLESSIIDKDTSKMPLSHTIPTKFTIVPRHDLSRISFATDKEKNIEHSSITLKMIIITVFTIISSPFIICDFYFALTDTSCVNQNFQQININMRTYLLVSAIINLCVVMIYNLSILCFVENVNNGVLLFLKIFETLVKIFTVSWLIVGCVMFWSFMDTSICAKNVHSYLLARFIIMLVSVGMSVLLNKDEKNDKK